MAGRLQAELGCQLSSQDTHGDGGATAVAPPQPRLRARGVSKTFNGTRVLHDTALTVDSGEVRALLGQNGSGKSTFIKVLTGFHDADPGAQVELDGRLAVMHQDLGLEPTLSITDNFMLAAGREGSALRPIRWRRAHEEARRALRAFDLDVDVTRPVGALSGPERAVVSMVRALSQLGDDARGLLVLDEPTASLERDAIQALFRAVRAVRDRGCGVLFVSHDLDEVLSLCDTVSVLRDGALVAEGELARFSKRGLIEAIVGRDIGELYPPAPVVRSTPVVLSARGLRGTVVDGIDLDVHRGEVVGVTGVAGMGQDELPMLLYGASRAFAGEVRVDGIAVRPDPRAALAAGMALLPADRKAHGGDMAATVEQNLTLPVLGRYRRGGRLDRGGERRDVLGVLRDFDVRPADPLRKLGELSGGNQQKALLGKWMRLYADARVLLLHEPTQGVDIGARQEIFRHIRDAAEQGVAVLYVSCEHEDLAHLCDRVLVVRHGRIAATLEHDQLDAGRLAAVSLAA